MVEDASHHLHIRGTLGDPHSMLGKLRHGKKKGGPSAHPVHARTGLLAGQGDLHQLSCPETSSQTYSVILALGPWIASTHPCKKEEMRASFTLSCSSSLATVKRVESHQHGVLDSKVSGSDIPRTSELPQEPRLCSPSPEQALF